jgi:hypothetical protein
MMASPDGRTHKQRTGGDYISFGRAANRRLPFHFSAASREGYAPLTRLATTKVTNPRRKIAMISRQIG